MSSHVQEDPGVTAKSEDGFDESEAEEAPGARPPWWKTIAGIALILFAALFAVSSVHAISIGRSDTVDAVLRFILIATLFALGYNLAGASQWMDRFEERRNESATEADIPAMTCPSCGRTTAATTLGRCAYCQADLQS
jgi:uncharacterized paraquat-inducible protein A